MGEDPAGGKGSQSGFEWGRVGPSPTSICLGRVWLSCYFTSLRGWLSLPRSPPAPRLLPPPPSTPTGYAFLCSCCCGFKSPLRAGCPCAHCLSHPCATLLLIPFTYMHAAKPFGEPAPRVSSILLLLLFLSYSWKICFLFLFCFPHPRPHSLLLV